MLLHLSQPAQILGLAPLLGTQGHRRSQATEWGPKKEGVATGPVLACSHGAPASETLSRPGYIHLT